MTKPISDHYTYISSGRTKRAADRSVWAIYHSSTTPNGVFESSRQFEVLDSLPLKHLYRLRPNKPLQRTPLRVERDRGFFESWNRLESFPDLEWRRR